MVAGEHVGPYLLEALLGAGGMGEVWKARDTRLDRIVAIKFSQAAFSDRFQREARAVAALNHPNIATLYDVGPDYLVMEYVEGAPVGPGGGMRRILDLAAQIADGLAAAHAAGLAHRDLKPDNILVTRAGQVKILDFGLARQTGIPAQDEATLTVTQPGTVLGTIGYMSPEQVRGAEAGHRSDIFSFGVILHELVTGERPFRRDTVVETMNAILKEDPPELPDSVPSGLRQVIAHALEKEPDQRFQSVKDMGFALRTLSALTQAPSAAAASRRSWIRTAAAGLGAGALAGGAYWAGRRSVRVTTPSFRQLTSRQGFVTRARFAGSGETLVYSAHFEDGPAKLYVSSPGDGAVHEIEVPDLVSLAAVSSKNEAAVILKGDVLARMPLSGGAPRPMLENVVAADWAPDGEDLAVVRRSGRMIRVEYPVGRVLRESGAPTHGIRVSPDGSRVAISYFTNGFHVAVLDRGGKTIDVAHFDSSAGFSIARPCWTPDGREIWIDSPALDEHGVIHAFDLRGNRRVVSTLPGTAMVESISNSGKLLVNLVRNRFGIAGRTKKDATDRDLSWSELSSAVALTPDGATMVFTGSDRTRSVVYLRKTDGTPAVRLCEGINYGGQPVSPDGKWVPVYRPSPADRATYLVPTGAGEEKRIDVEGMEPGPLIVAWLPDGDGYVITAVEKGKPWGQARSRLYVWKPAARLLRPLSAEGLTHPIRCDPKVERCLLRPAGGTWKLYPVDGSAPVEAKGIRQGDHPLNFTEDGRGIWVAEQGEAGSAVVSRVDWAGGKRERWKEIQAPQGARVRHDTIAITPDGRSYVYIWVEARSELYQVEGLL